MKTDMKRPVKKDPPKSSKRNTEFLIELIKFFKGSICGTADSVNTLANIQKKFPEEYKEIQKSRLDPSKIDVIMEKMNPEEKDVFLLIYAKSSYIAPKLNRVFDLSLKEKQELAETITNFATYVEEKLTSLVKGVNGEKK